MRESLEASGSLLRMLQSIRGYLRRRAGVALFLVCLTIVGGVLGLAWVFAGPDGWTPGTVLPLALLALGALAGGTLLGWLQRRLRGWTRESNLAQEIERAASLPEGSVRAQVELARSVPEGVSPSLARAGAGALISRLPEGVERLAGVPGRDLVRLSRIGAFGAASAVIILAALFVLAPSRARAAWAGLTQPVALLRPEPLPPLELLPGDAALPRGETPEVAVRAVGRQQVTVHWQGIGDIQRDRDVEVTEGLAEATLPELEVETRYWASSVDGAVTPVSTLVPSDPSLLADLTLDVAYPAHTRLPSQTFRGVPVWLQVPVGTVIRIAGRVAGEGSDVLLVGDGGRAVAQFPVVSGGFSGVWSPTASELITWAVGGGQEGAVLPQTLEIEVLPDTPPELALPVPGADGELPLSLRVPLLIEGNDDFGVSWVEVETTHQRPGEDDVTVVDRIPTGELPQVTLRPVLDVSTWGIRAGDAILVKARASDNAPVGQIVETISYRFAMPMASDLRDAARARIEEATSRTREILDRVSRETEALRNLERQSRLSTERARGDSDTPDAFQDREELRQVLEQQAELASELDELLSRLEETDGALAEMAEDSPEDAELRDRIEELEGLLEDILDPEARARLEEMQERFREGEIEDDVEQIMEELTERQEDLQARLEQALEQLRRREMEEAFQGAEEELRALLETQEALVEELAQGEGEEAQLEQADRAEELAGELGALEEELSASGDAEAASQTESARQEVSEAREAMEAAAEASESGDQEEAAEQAAEAQESLEAALEQLAEAQSEAAESPEEEMQEGLWRGAQAALALARRQGELRTEVAASVPGDRQAFEGEQVAIREGLRNLRAEVAEAAESSPELASELSEAIAAAQEAVDSAVQGLRGTSGPQPDPRVFADSAQARLNEFALRAMAAAEGGGQSGETPSSQEEMGEELASLGAQQSSLNEDASQMSEQSSAGGTPAPMELENLTAGQEGVAARLQALASMPGPGGRRGNLDALAEESSEIAEALGEGRLDATTLGRQERFLERLLDAGRTLERDGPTDEREATSAEATPRRAVTALPEDLLESGALSLPSPAELGALSPAQRRLVLDYFERVNRRRAAGGGR